MFGRSATIASAIVLLSLTQSVLAFDLFPAPFRGQPGSVYAHWDFPTNANPAPVDAFNLVPLGNAPVYTVPVEVEITNFVYFNDGNVNGWVSVPADDFSILNFSVPNFIDFEPVKQLWIQVGYFNFNQENLYPFVAAIEANDNEVGFVLGELTGAITVPELGYRLETWEIHPNPDFELVQFIVPPWILVDQVTIDTISTVPEASTLTMMCLVGMGVTGAAWRRLLAAKNR
jgi:hypothetical protein